MKYYLIGAVLDTKSFGTAQEMQEVLQRRLDSWLGKDKTQINVEELNDHTMKFTLYRKYGNWFEDPQRFQPQTSVFSWDEHILLGDDYQTGTTADFETLTGRYVISYNENDFFADYKEKAKENHCSRIKHLSQQSYLDRIELTVELLKYQTKKNKSHDNIY
jgi:hypothetical protein